MPRSNAKGRLAAAGALLLLGACNGHTLFGSNESSSQPPPGISYRVTGEDLSATNRQADQYCQQFGKKASLKSNDKAPDGNSTIASYSCG